MEEKYLTVSAVTKYIKHKFDTDEHLRTVFIKGEISNFKSHTTGHFYFSLKDETSKINAIMFGGNTKNINFNPIDGMKVLVVGRISVYEATGNYQIYVEEMIEDGVGNLYIAFEKLKKDLEKEGLFDQSHKLNIPKIPDKIGIITASTGAAIKDILTTLKRRYNKAEVILFPSLVQGDSAAYDIVKNINLAQNYDLDVIILGRGGGSIEDLWPFNEEVVARAIYNSNIPIISAVGHEVDFTISDFVSDLRAPTPTAAAELAVPNLNDLINHVDQLKIRLKENILKSLNIQKLLLTNLKTSFIVKNPNTLYENKKIKLDTIKEFLIRHITDEVTNKRIQFTHLKSNYILMNPNTLYEKDIIKLNTLIEKLELVNPLSILKKGYSLTSQDNVLIKSIKDINKTKELKTKLSDGTVTSTITNIERN